MWPEVAGLWPEVRQDLGSLHSVMITNPDRRLHAAVSGPARRACAELNKGILHGWGSPENGSTHLLAVNLTQQPRILELGAVPT
jgi:hypothetical protein